MDYQLMFSDILQSFVRTAPPDVRAVLKRKLHQLRQTPCMGKPLLKKLSGYYSVRTSTLRIIYKIISDRSIIEVHHIGPRRDLYEIFNQLRNGIHK